MSETLLARPMDRTSSTGKTKVERYGWTLVDSPGDFAMIPKDQFVVDMTYQRNLKEARVLKIAREWSWIACGTIKAVLRPGDAAYVVIDGQHRVEAATRRTDITDLPTLIFEVDDIAAEASGFLKANIMRKPPSLSSRYNALVTSHDPSAEILQELLEGSGRRVSDASNIDTISCVGAMIRCIEANEKATRTIWPIIVDLCKGQRIHQKLVYGLFYIETHMTSGSLSQRAWRSRLEAIGYSKLLDSIMKASAYLGTATPKASAEGLAQAINKGLQKKLPFVSGGEMSMAKKGVGE